MLSPCLGPRESSGWCFPTRLQPSTAGKLGSPGSWGITVPAYYRLAPSRIICTCFPPHFPPPGTCCFCLLTASLASGSGGQCQSSNTSRSVWYKTDERSERSHTALRSSSLQLLLDTSLHVVVTLIMPPHLLVQSQFSNDNSNFPYLRIILDQIFLKLAELLHHLPPEGLWCSIFHVSETVLPVPEASLFLFKADPPSLPPSSLHPLSLSSEIWTTRCWDPSSRPTTSAEASLGDRDVCERVTANFPPCSLRPAQHLFPQDFPLWLYKWTS